ncbi:MAG TPA: crosslink repair DNA glycosylase YcaQ family protein, partial [Acidimicrobiales bacterium]|nr:crosslink repair DNA glycosylase YcaQ family protein [Acidimicrobiales bacterium]
MDHLSIGEARRMALAAQGFNEKRPTGNVGRRQLQKVVDRLQVIQLDSVNVAVRSHYMPFFSRLGPYPVAELDTLAWATHHLFEYWGHQASLLPVELQPLFRWKMAQHKHDRQSRWLNALEREHPGYIQAVLDEVRERGPLAAGELTDPGKKTGPWWGYSKGKQTLEYLFWTGQVTANRRSGFERVYDVPERALPADVLAAPTPTEQEARKTLLDIGARVLGVGTVGDLTNYFMLNIPKTRPAVDELVEEGMLVPVKVEGWKQPSYR